MGYCGTRTIDDLRTRARFIQVTGASVQEGHPHDSVITQEAPNYSSFSAESETGRGSALARGVVTGMMTTLGGVFHSLPFVIKDVHTALVVAGVVVGCELIAISLIRKRFLSVPLRLSLVQVALGGALIVAAGVLLGNA